MITDTVTLAEFAKRNGCDRMQAYRWAAKGKLGPVLPGAGRNGFGRRVYIAELVARGLLEPEPAQPAPNPSYETLLRQCRILLDRVYATFPPDKEARIDAAIALMEQLASIEPPSTSAVASGQPETDDALPMPAER